MLVKLQDFQEKVSALRASESLTLTNWNNIIVHIWMGPLEAKRGPQHDKIALYKDKRGPYKGEKGPLIRMKGGQLEINGAP